jgi:muramoyltetrapeptide carboxypeptidase
MRSDRVEEILNRRHVEFARPPRLRAGDTVALVAASGPVPPESFAEGAAILGARYRVVHDDRVLARRGFLAGDDDARAAALADALGDANVRAVVCARGGYGLLRILSRLDARAFAAAPKPLVGFSDVTALHAWALGAGVRTIHGPVVTQLARVPAADRDALVALLEDDAPPPLIGGLRALAPGRGEGPLVGGNLEVLSRLVGTPWAAPLAGAVLVLEDIGERPYRIDRALTQLLAAGALAGVRAVVLGDFVRCDEPDMPSPEEVVVERLAPLGVPIVAGAPLGHGERNRAVPLGAACVVDAGAGTLTFREGAVK